MARTLRGYIADLRDPLTVPACERQGEPAPGGLASVAPISLGHGGGGGRHPIGGKWSRRHPFKVSSRAGEKFSHHRGICALRRRILRYPQPASDLAPPPASKPSPLAPPLLGPPSRVQRPSCASDQRNQDPGRR